MSNTEQPKGIFLAMTAVMKDITAIGKNSRNQQQGFQFRGIDAVYNDLHPLMAKHGIITMPSAGTPVVEERASKNGGVLRFVSLPMTYTFIAQDGSCVVATVIGEGMDSGDKATNKAMAIAHKYVLLQTFLIPTEDMVDPDSETVEVAPRQQAKAPAAPATPARDWNKELFALMDRDKVEEKDIFAYLKSKDAKTSAGFVADLPANFKKGLITKWGEVVAFAFNSVASTQEEA